MEFLQLKYFCDAAQTENLSKTAEKFMVPVSSVSQSIKRLEKELGNPLFARTKNRLSLNATGQAFYNEAQKALDTLEEAAYTVKNLQPRKSIAINVHIARWVVTDAIEEFHRKHPDVTFMTSCDLDADMQDFGIVVTGKNISSPYDKTEVIEENIVLAYSRKHFPQVENLRPQDLKDFPFITTATGSAMEQFTHRICADLGFTPHVVLQSEDTFFFRRCIALGQGVAIVPEKTYSGHIADHVAFKQLGQYRYKVYVYRKNNENPYLKEFATLLEEEFSKRTQ